MLTYDYHCMKCAEAFEVEQSMTDAPLETHLDEFGKICGPVKRLISGGVGFQLKGSGWSKDGYGSGGEKKKE